MLYKYLHLFEKLNIFKGMSLDDIVDFLKNSDYIIKELKPYDLIDPSKFGMKTVIPIKGHIATYQNDKGFISYISSYRPGENELVAVHPQIEQSSVMIVAREISVVLLLDYNAFTKPNYNILPIQNKVQGNIIDMVFLMCQNVLARDLVNSFPTAREKILKYIKHLFEEQQSNPVKVPLTRNMLGDYLKMDTSTLMRELKKLKAEGVIDYNRKFIYIKGQE